MVLSIFVKRVFTQSVNFNAIPNHSARRFEEIKKSTAV